MSLSCPGVNLNASSLGKNPESDTPFLVAFLAVGGQKKKALRRTLVHRLAEMSTEKSGTLGGLVFLSKRNRQGCVPYGAGSVFFRVLVDLENDLGHSTAFLCGSQGVVERDPQ